MNSTIIPSPLATFPLGPGQTQDNLTGLPNGYALGLGVLGQLGIQYYDDNVGPIQVRTGSLVSPGGTVSLYIVGSEDSIHWDGGLSPNGSTDQSMGLAFLSPARTITTTNTNTIYTFDEFSIASIKLFMPTFWAVVVYNRSGSAFDPNSANFYAQHAYMNYAS